MDNGSFHSFQEILEEGGKEIIKKKETKYF